MKKVSGKKANKIRTAYSRAALITLLVALVSITLFNVKKIADGSESEMINLEKMLVPYGGEYSYGNDHGYFYSIDGLRISDDIDDTHYALPGFSSVIGSEGSSGLILACNSTLYSSASKSNIKNRAGNNISTTLHYQAQLTANELLKTYYSYNCCDEACVAVLLRDGAILVSTGLNEYDYAELTSSDEMPKHACINYNLVNSPVGSVAKAITARTLLENNGKLSEEYSLYNTEFEDYSWYAANGVQISNWDYLIPSNYEYENCYSQYVRHVNLSQALCRSSNTYFWRHALSLGLQETFDSEKELFNITIPINSDVMTIPGIDEDVRLDYYFWGQDMACSPIRLASLYNHALSGECYTPFYVAAVRSPDGDILYKASPKRRSSLDIKVKKDDILKAGLSDCFEYYSQWVSPSVYEKYSSLIEEHRLLAKSGTADVDEERGLTNNVRVLTILGENHEVIATSVIMVERSDGTNINETVLFSILLQTLEAAGIL